MALVSALNARTVQPPVLAAGWLEEHLEMQLTLLTDFSGIFDTSAGFPFLDGVLLILGEWNLSISFMVKEER